MNLKEIVKVNRIEKLEFKRVDLSQKNIDGGIYRMFDDYGVVIYVGKSGNLRRRVDDHLDRRTHTSYFMDEVAFIEWLEEPDPYFETLLEAIFIAYHQPKYNDETKDHRKKFGDEFEPK
jgi:excinuclease UvrABC nuclease subunit